VNQQKTIIRLKIEPSDTVGRMDKCLAGKLVKDLSRSDIKRLIAMGNVSLNDLIVKPNHKVKIGDKITVTLEEKTAEQGLIGADIPLNIIFRTRIF
jgi:23S rRNA pseudouridine1911/1915/1917 synthase